MTLWVEWYRCVQELRGACSRGATYLWMTLALVGLSIRSELGGVTSFVRAAFLEPEAYPRLLHLFHTPALRLGEVTRLWIRLGLKLFSPLRSGGRLVCVADGLKVPKEGRKMPAVKKLHQESGDNTKPPFIFGHSFQALALLVQGPLGHVAAVPLISRIQEGVVFSNRDHRSLLDKFVLLFRSVAEVLGEPLLLLADAYFASRKVIQPLLEAGHHLLTRVRTNTVAYRRAPRPARPRRGRPRLYGSKLRLRDLWTDRSQFVRAPSPVYGEGEIELAYRSIDLLWRPIGRLVRFVLVDHPTRGRLILLSTDRSLAPLQMLSLYGYRFKIELSFKQALRILGTYAYHFWMKTLTPRPRRSGNHYLHRKTEAYRNGVRRKIAAYHRYVQLGCIAQGIHQHLSFHHRKPVWAHFQSWMRTMNPGAPPSEAVVAQALRNSLSEFLLSSHQRHDLEKFIAENAVFDRIPALRMAG